MSSLDGQAIAWLRSHHSTISDAALSTFGLTVEQRKELVRAGLLVRLLDGGYAFAGVEHSELTRCAAICTSRPHLVIGGPTAGRLLGIRRSPNDGLVHVLAPPHSQPCNEPWVRAYRTPLIFVDDIVERGDGIRVTTPERTAVDLTRYLRDDALMSAIEHVLSLRYADVDGLVETAERLNTPGRPWVRRFLKVLARRSPGRPSESEPELLVHDALVSRGVVGLVRQYDIMLPGYGAARFDMAIPSLRWALEVDVHPEHRTTEGVARDNLRDDAADRLGWFVRRVSDAEISRFDDTIDRLVAGIARRRSQAL